MSPFDAVVVGAGPAGAVAARDLARSGARVALLDGSHPREKPCGGGVTGRALQLVGATLPGAPGQAIDAVTFEAGGRSARVPLPDREALRVFPRAAFDAALLRQAVDAGATHIRSRVHTVTRRSDVWQVAAGDATITAPWLLGADGPTGVVRKQVFRPFERRQLSIAAGSYIDGVDTGEIVIAFTTRPSGYLWSFPRAGHLAVGTCAQAHETTAAEMHAATDRWLDGYAPAKGLARRRYAWPIPSLEARDVDAEQPAGDGWMLLGDAAGLVDPITREGIFFALRSAQFAADALADGGDPAARYEEALRDDIYPELSRAARVKSNFFRGPFTRLLIDALHRSEPVRTIMRDLVAGTQPYRTLRKRLLGTFEVGLAWQLLRLQVGL
jgi:geranylgeranyl diphosphate/geranylgeranyl-bacteriochlorophyllide a reductase